MPIAQGGKHNITIYEGAAFFELFELFEDDEMTEPLDFVDGTIAQAQLRVAQSRSSTLVADFDVLVVDNKLSIALGADVEFSVFKGYYDIFVIEPLAEPIMFMEGKATINPAVTE